MKPISKYLNKTLKISMILSVLCLSEAAFALNTNSSQASPDLIKVINPIGQNLRGLEGSSFQSVIQPLRHAQVQSNTSSLRSKSDVMREVKNRYNGQVVKISLNERTATYNVRVLLPSGKVKNLSVSARK